MSRLLSIPKSRASGDFRFPAYPIHGLAGSSFKHEHLAAILADARQRTGIGHGISDAPAVLGRHRHPQDVVPLRQGHQVVVEGFRSKTSDKVANARTVKLPDGRQVFAGSSFDPGEVK